MHNGIPNKLVELMHILETLPSSEGVFPISCQIDGFPAFFPCGRGFVSPDFPERPVMFLGHNFDTEANFKASVVRGFEGDPKAKTWPNLLTYFLPEAGLQEEDCFFTNLYLGAIALSLKKAEAQKNTGKFVCSDVYRRSCLSALHHQVRIVRPKVIALLGAHVLMPFAAAFPEYSVVAKRRIADAQHVQPVGGVRLHFDSAAYAQVIALYHPSNPRSIDSHKLQGRLLADALFAFQK